MTLRFNQSLNLFLQFKIYDCLLGVYYVQNKILINYLSFSLVFMPHITTFSLGSNIISTRYLIIINFIKDKTTQRKASKKFSKIVDKIKRSKVEFSFFSAQLLFIITFIILINFFLYLLSLRELCCVSPAVNIYNNKKLVN